MFYYLLFLKKEKNKHYLSDVCNVIYCPKGKCPIEKFNDDDYILAFPHKNSGIPKGGTYLNSPLSIFLNKNKPISRMVLKDAGILIPKTWYYIEQAETPYIARPKTHYQGKHTHVIRTQEEHEKFKKSNIYNHDWYFSELLNITKEIRTIWFNNEMIYAYDLLVFNSVEETISKRDEIPLDENHPSEFYYDKLTEEEKLYAKQALDAVGLFYGAVDLMYTEDNKIYISEVNSYPTIRDPIKPRLKNAIIKFKKENGIK